MTTLYALLNADAKSWWYHKRLRQWGRDAEARAEERKSIKRAIEYVREAEQRGGYLLLLTTDRFILSMHDQSVLSGYGDVLHLQALCSHLNVPVFDLKKVGSDSYVWNEPLYTKDRIAYYRSICNEPHHD